MTGISIISASELNSQRRSNWINLLPTEGPMANPFLRPEYVEFAGRVFPNIEIAVVSDAGVDQAFFAYERTAKDTAVPVGRFLSDLHGIVSTPDLDWNAVQLIRNCDLSAWQFDHLISDQKLFQSHHSLCDDSYFMDLHKGYDAYYNDRKSATSLVKQAARKYRKLERELGPIQFKAHDNSSAAWKSLAHWKSQHLIQHGYADMFRFDWVQDLLAELQTVDEPDFAPLLSTVYAGDKMLAVHLALRVPHVINSWIPTCDPAWAKYSPGLILQLELAKWAANTEVNRIDLGRGENQTKLGLASDSFPVAIGSVDRRMLRRTWTRTYYGLRNLVHGSPFRDASLKVIHRVKACLDSYKHTRSRRVNDSAF